MSWNTVIKQITEARGKGKAAGLVDGFDTTLQQMLHSRSVIDGLDRLRSDDFRVEESGSIYEGTKIITIHSSEGWDVNLGCYGSDALYAKTSAGPLYFVLLEEDESVRLHHFEIEGDVDDLSTRRSWQLRRHSRTDVTSGKLYSVPTDNRPIFIEGKGADVAFLQISGPAEVPLVHGFDLESGNFAYTAFANERATGLSFYLEVTHLTLSDPTIIAALSDEDRAALARRFADNLHNWKADDTSQWRMVQILGLLDPGLALEALGTMKDHRNRHIASRARAIIANTNTAGSL